MKSINGQGKKIEEKKMYLLGRIENAVRSCFTGTISFEINFSEGGIRTIKSKVEDIRKF